MKSGTVLSALCALIAYCALSLPAFALELNPTLSDYVQRSNEIAIVRIIRVERLQPKPSSKTTCGHLYKAVVKRSIKGGESSFNFYSNPGFNYLGSKYKYLVIAVPFPKPKTKFDALNSDLLNVCQSKEAVGYWVPWRSPLIAPLVGSKDGDWILTARYSVLFLSVFNVKKTIINDRCYAKAPLREALGLITAAGHSNDAVDDYLKNTYPRGGPRYFLADPCGWIPGPSHSKTTTK